MIAKLTTKFTACSANAQPSNQVSQNFASAANPAESTSDTSSRNPMPRIMPNDSSRPRSSAVIPDPVDFGLQFAEHRRRADEQCHDAGDRRERPFARLARALDKALDGRRAFVADQPAKLREDFATR